VLLRREGWQVQLRNKTPKRRVKAKRSPATDGLELGQSIRTRSTRDPTEAARVADHRYILAFFRRRLNRLSTFVAPT
jgi:hypothetical protein